MNNIAQFYKIVNSNRWVSFLESTAKGLQVNLTLLLSEINQVQALAICPVCLGGYAPLTASDVQRAFEIVREGLSNFITEQGDPAIILLLDGGIPLIVRGCPACSEMGNMQLTDRAQIVQKLVNSFYTALDEGFQGGSRALEISTLRQMNHIILSLFQGKEDSVHRSFDLILSALIIILDAQGSWLQLNDPLLPRALYKGDREVIPDYFNSGLGSSAVEVEISNSGIKGKLGVLAPADIEQARDLLPLMAQEVAIVIEIDNLFKLFQKRLIRVLDAIDSAIVLIDKKGTLSYVNLPFERLFGIPKLSVIGKPFAMIAGPWSPPIKLGINRQVEGKVDFLNINNRQVCVDWQVSPLFEEDAIQGWVLFVKDRTDYYRWQEAVRDAERLATTTTLVGSLAHELRNPLSAAKALLQLTRQKGNTHQTGGYIDLVQREIDRVTRLLNEFLLLGKPADKKVEPVQLALLLQELIPLLESEAANYRSELIVDLQAKPFIQGDPGQLTQVVMNLVRNAAEASGAGGSILITLQENEGKALLTVQDTGPGINPNIQDKLFRPFFTTKERGTGLGLPIVQAIVLNHGGDIRVENAGEGGAVFLINLPAHQKERVVQVDVLMTVNDPMIKYPSEQAIREAGFNMVTADNFDQGIALIDHCQPQIVVMENSLLESTENLKLLQLKLGNAKLVIIGEPCSSYDFDDLNCIPKPLNYTRLVSQLKLIQAKGNINAELSGQESTISQGTFLIEVIKDRGR